MTTTVLEIRGDSSSLQRAAKQAGTALDETGRKAERMAAKAKVGGNNLSAAFGATGGGIAVTRGLVSIGDGFKSANTGMALFAASQALLDVGRLSNDMSAVASATGATGGAFSKLGAIIKANPLLTIAAVIAGAATAMGLFGGETKETADEWERLGKGIRDARLSGQVKDYLGLPNNRGQELSGLESTIGKYLENGSNLTTFSDLSKVSGLGQGRLRFAAKDAGLGYVNSGDPDSSQRILSSTAAAILRQIYTEIAGQAKRNAPALQSPVAATPSIPASVSTPGYASGAFSQDPAANNFFNWGAGTSQYRENQRIDQFQLGQRQAGAIRFGQGALGPRSFDIDFSGVARDGDLIRQSAAERDLVAQQSMDKAKQAMDDLVRQGQEFGATLADAFIAAGTGAASLRNAMAQVASQLARSGLTKGLASLGGAVAGYFAPTGTQARTPGSTPGKVP